MSDPVGKGWVGEGGQTGGTIVDTGGLTDSPETRAIVHAKLRKKYVYKNISLFLLPLSTIKYHYEKLSKK